MATIKSFTDLSQSKKLAEILPHESADMLILNNIGKSGNVDGTNFTTILKENLNPLAEVPEILPCWSLVALLNSIPHYTLRSPNLLSDKYCCICVEYEIETYGDTQLDAVFQMIIWLKENNKL